MNRKSYTVAIIGAGNIAASFDMPDDNHILSHAHAISLNPRLKCLGFYDINEENAKKASLRWGFPVLESFDDLLRKTPDIIVICSPDNQHIHNLIALLPHPISFILCEKPLTTSYKDSKRILSLLRKKGISLMANYQRRYDQTVIRLKNEIDKGSYGKPLAINILYSKGILHNGSHAVNLILYFFGKPNGATISRKTFDFYNEDPTVDATLFYDSFLVNFIAGDESKFSLFEVDMIFERTRFRFTDSGNDYEHYVVAPDPLYPNYKELRIETKENTELRYALRYVYEHIICLLDDNKKQDDYLIDVLNTQFICEILANATLYKYKNITSIETY